MTFGRGLVRSAFAKPAHIFVPPPPISGIPSARHSGYANPAAASHGSTETWSRLLPTARPIAATSMIALPSSASLTDPRLAPQQHRQVGGHGQGQGFELFVRARLGGGIAEQGKQIGGDVEPERGGGSDGCGHGQGGSPLQ